MPTLWASFLFLNILLHSIEFTFSTARCPYAGGQTQPSAEMSLAVADDARVFEEATIALRTGDGPSSTTKFAETKAECERRRMYQCNPQQRWRSGDGRCNNLQNTHWGIAHGCMTRLLEPAYEDGVSEPRGGRFDSRLPNARVVSTTVNEYKNASARNFTIMVMQIGQFLDHDIALAPMEEISEIKNLGNPNDVIDCCSEDRRDASDCFSFDIAENDSFFGGTNRTCHNMVRSLPCSNCETGPRQQQDSLTSYIDASQIYGSSDADNLRLRAKSKGMLKNQVVSGRELLPRSFHPDEDRCSTPSEGKFCFRAGDERVNEQPGLTALHIIWLRQHNHVAQNLSEINPHWDDERLFQETRRIIGAQWQRIIFNEFLPIVLGPDQMKAFQLTPLKSGFTQYNPKIDGTIINEFAAAAYRFGHTLIDTHYDLEDSQGNVDSIQLQESFFFPFNYYKGMLDPMLRALSSQPAQRFDRFVVPDVTNHLYRLFNDSFGFDLVGLNIQRSRDHGIRPYIDYVRYCSDRDIKDWSELNDIMPQDAIRKLSQVYPKVEDVDLFPAGISEFAVREGVVGPTFACILGNQFMRSKFGDRFYHEHEDQAGSFTKEQLQEIRKITLAKIICDNSDGIEKIQRNVFRFPGRDGNPSVACSKIDRSNLKAWTDRNRGS